MEGNGLDSTVLVFPGREDLNQHSLTVRRLKTGHPEYEAGVLLCAQFQYSLMIIVVFFFSLS